MKSPWQKIKGEWSCNASELRFHDQLPDGTVIDKAKLAANLGLDDGFNKRDVSSWSMVMANGKRVTIFNDNDN